jgi:hypothetical protein
VYLTNIYEGLLIGKYFSEVISKSLRKIRDLKISHLAAPSLSGNAAIAELQTSKADRFVDLFSFVSDFSSFSFKIREAN